MLKGLFGLELEPTLAICITVMHHKWRPSSCISLPFAALRTSLENTSCKLAIHSLHSGHSRNGHCPGSFVLRMPPSLSLGSSLNGMVTHILGYDRARNGASDRGLHVDMQEGLDDGDVIGVHLPDLSKFKYLRTGSSLMHLITIEWFQAVYLEIKEDCAIMFSDLVKLWWTGLPWSHGIWSD